MRRRGGRGLVLLFEGVERAVGCGLWAVGEWRMLGGCGEERGSVGDVFGMEMFIVAVGEGQSSCRYGAEFGMGRFAATETKFVHTQPEGGSFISIRNGEGFAYHHWNRRV